MPGGCSSGQRPAAAQGPARVPPHRACQARPQRPEGGGQPRAKASGRGRGSAEGRGPRAPTEDFSAATPARLSRFSLLSAASGCAWRFGAACPASHHSSSAPWWGAALAPPSRPTASYRLHGDSPGACDAGDGQRKLCLEAGPPRSAPTTAAPGGGGRAGPARAGPVRRGRAAW